MPFPYMETQNWVSLKNSSGFLYGNALCKAFIFIHRTKAQIVRNVPKYWRQNVKKCTVGVYYGVCVRPVILENRLCLNH